MPSRVAKDKFSNLESSKDSTRVKGVEFMKGILGLAH